MEESRTNLVYSIIGVVIVAILIGGSFYLFSYNKDGHSADGSRLVSASKLAVETEAGKLAELERRYNAERAVIKDIQSQYSNIRNSILKKTDIFFDDPNSSNPKIRIKITDKKVLDDINRRRLQVSKLLKIWDERYNIIETDSPSIALLPSLPDMVKEAKNDIKYIEEYIKALQNIVGDLTPQDSGLTQSEINYYETVVTTNSKEIEKVVANIVLVETHTAQIYQPQTSTTTPVVVNNNSNPTPPPVVPPIVTPSQIQAQQDALTQAQEEEDNSDEEVVEPPPPPPASDSLPPYYMYLQTNPSPTTAKYLPNPFADHTGWPDIVPNTQSGLPSLIDGSNN